MIEHRTVSLFAGIGGFDLAFERAGFEIAAHVEIDPNCRKLLAAKWPDAVSLEDVRTAGAHNLPACDVVTFGFPCQDLSVAGKRGGLAGSRSGLFYEATRIIDELKPAFCLFENVPGLLSSDDGRDFARVLMELDRIGYCGAWRVLDAQWFGVAQRRRRVFGLFTRLDTGAERCAEILSLRESLRGHPAPRREAGEGTAGTITGGASGGSGHGKKSGTDREGFLTVAKAVRTPTGGIDREDMHTLIPAVARSLNSERDGCNDGSDQTYLPVVAGWWNGSSVADALGTSTDGQRMPDRGRLQAVVAPTVTSKWAKYSGGPSGSETNNLVSASMSIRRLTPTECERLQGFPDGWTSGFADSVRYRMLGNAVAVPVVHWIARRMAGSSFFFPTPNAEIRFPPKE